MRFVLVTAVLMLGLLFGCALKPGYGIWNSGSPSTQAEATTDKFPNESGLSKCEDLFKSYTQGGIWTEGFELKQGFALSRAEKSNIMNSINQEGSSFVSVRYRLGNDRSSAICDAPSCGNIRFKIKGTEIGENENYIYLLTPFFVKIIIPNKSDENGTVIAKGYEIEYRIDKLIFTQDGKIINMECE